MRRFEKDGGPAGSLTEPAVMTSSLSKLSSWSAQIAPHLETRAYFVKDKQSIDIRLSLIKYRVSSLLHHNPMIAAAQPFYTSPCGGFCVRSVVKPRNVM